MSGKEILAKTVYGEARGETEQGWRWVAWVIKNSADANKSYWGGSRIKDVCLCPGQFECWEGRARYTYVNVSCIRERERYRDIKEVTDEVYDAPMYEDPTGGCDHYNNPDVEPYRDWRNNVHTVRRIGKHVFYKSKHL